MRFDDLARDLWARDPWSRTEIRLGGILAASFVDDPTEAFLRDLELDLDGLRFRAWGEMLLLRATPAHPPRDPQRREHRPQPVRASARRVRRRWRKPSGRTAPVLGRFQDVPGLDVAVHDLGMECPATCSICLSPIPAGEPVHTATARSPRYASDEDDGGDLEEREVSWCDACDLQLGSRRGGGGQRGRVGWERWETRPGA